MSEPLHISEIMLKIAADPKNQFGRVLRRCPFVQAELIHRKLMSLDDLTDEQIDQLIEWDQKNDKYGRGNSK